TAKRMCIALGKARAICCKQALKGEQARRPSPPRQMYGQFDAFHQTAYRRCRAGEAGKGFAVVANEVKELAKQTAKATEDISRKIEAIQGDTKGAVEAIARIGKIINQINDIQNTIASAVEEQTATTGEISRNVSAAAKGSSEIAHSITGVAQAARITTE